MAWIIDLTFYTAVNKNSHGLPVIYAWEFIIPCDLENTVLFLLPIFVKLE